MLNKREIHVFVPVLIALILNYVIFIKKWGSSARTTKQNDKLRGLIPDGKIVGFVWILIFMLLGNAHFILYKKNKMSLASIFLIFVVIYCISYPIVTQLDQKKGRIMNTISLILSSILMLLVYIESREAFIYTIPLFIWTSFVNYSDATVCTDLIN